jgi:predicted nucleotide-binding protein with TIR-like domain
VKPRIFIGSSGASEKYAAAIHDGLVNDAECTVWTENAFGLSKSTVDNLMKNLRDSDFGIFVFAPDDTATIKGDLLSVTRDNVVYEAGLFGGYLSPERCFIVIPRSAKIRIPTDLLGMTLGFYEDMRTDKNYVSAVSGFCRQIRDEILKQGLFTGHPHEQLRELSVKFDCCEWIPNDPDPKNPSKTRVDRKAKVAAEIDTFCRVHAVNKYRLLQRHQMGYYIALLSAIRLRPEAEDADLILQIKPAQLPHGFACYRLMDAVEALKANACCTPAQVSALSAWLKKLPKADAAISGRIAKFEVP